MPITNPTNYSLKNSDKEKCARFCYDEPTCYGFGACTGGCYLKNSTFLTTAEIVNASCSTGFKTEGDPKRFHANTLKVKLTFWSNTELDARTNANPASLKSFHVY